MKFECPNCKKVMMIKDEYAGKTGRCPECGQKVTLPQTDMTTGTAPDEPESEAIMAADSAKFIGAQEAKAPGGSRKTGLAVAAVLIVIAAAGFIYYLNAPARIAIPEMSMYNVASDRYVQRSKALPTDAIADWQKAIKQATESYLSGKQIFFKLPNIDALWQQDAFSKDVSDRYMARIAAVPLHALRDWRTALRRASDKEVGSDPADTLLRIIDVDRLFADGTFDNAASDRLLTRLNGLLLADVARWAEALKAEKGQAALNLALVDAFYTDGQFNAKRFEKKLKSMQ